MAPRIDPIPIANAAYVENLYARFLSDPESVPEDWRLFLQGVEFAALAPGAAAASTGGVFGLVLAYREFGHLISRLDPLGEPPAGHPLLELSAYGLGESDLDRDVDPRPFRGEFRGTLGQLVAALRETYGGTLGVEYMDISDARRREWLEERMERRRNRSELGPDERVRLLEALVAADAFEQFLHVKYPGQKRFSLEGGTALVPMLEALIEAAVGLGAERLVMGMPHRGRLNVLANVFGKPLERVFAEFESDRAPEEIQEQGDVKYHLGYSSRRETRSGTTVALHMHYNPSHLEFVNPVALGSVRARQAMAGDLARAGCWPVLLHGEAAFVGEGIVPETLTLAQLPAYQVGGTVHVIINNQVGFTTSPVEGRPTRYPTDIARVIESPVFHVSGDDPEMAVHAIRLAAAYRAEFHADAFVDLVCYRRHGHNELDDPTFTQPLMYRAIAAHRPLATGYAERLVREGVVDEATVRAIEAEVAQRLGAAYRSPRPPLVSARERTLGGAWQGLSWATDTGSAPTAVSRATLDQVIRAASAIPPEFEPHHKAAKLMAERAAMVEQDRVDWGAAEALAFGTLLLEGFHVRLSGQDTSRGTFSHRHAVLHDQSTGATHTPLEHLAPGQGRFEVINSMLSEAAVLGFEYGYSASDPHTLVVWEAQFGDFANAAQVIIDQFLASSEAKWNRMSGLTLLLPHGYEGQGPEHSSARLERFLELCAMGNLQVCNFTTPAQMFHALRRQMHRTFRKPLVIMSPKSLLRHRRAVSPASAFTSRGFEPVLDDGTVENRAAVRAVIATSGRLYYALDEARTARGGAPMAIVRIEQLYPFPRQEMADVLGRYPSAREVRWVQEEPANMGAWRHVRHRLEGVLPPESRLRLIARKAAPAPATGHYAIHVEEERLLIERAFDEGPGRDAEHIEAPLDAREAGR